MQHPTPLVAHVDTIGLIVRGDGAYDVVRGLRATYALLAGHRASPAHDVSQLRVAHVDAVRRRDVRPGRDAVAFRFSAARLTRDHLRTLLLFAHAHRAELVRLDVAYDLAGDARRNVRRYTPSIVTRGPIAGDAIRLRGDPLRRWRRHRHTWYVGHPEHDDVTGALYVHRTSKLGGGAPVFHVETRLLGDAIPEHLRRDPLALLDVDALTLLRRFMHYPKRSNVSKTDVRDRVRNVLVSRARHGIVTIGDRDLAERAKCPQTAVWRALAALADSGFIRVLQRQRGRGCVSRYAIAADLSTYGAPRVAAVGAGTGAA